MSLTVLLIGAAHGIPVVIAAAVMGKNGAVLAAIGMTIVAIFTGGPQYLIFDLVGIVGALWLCLAS
jgi:hypothetical protein